MCFICFHRPVCNASEVMQIISSVLKLRAHCPTLIHTDSSRSHLVVTLTISSKSPNAVALGETHSYAPSHTRTHYPFLLSWRYSFIQPAGYRVPRRTCSTPPRRSGGVHAVAVPTPPPATPPTSSLEAPPPLPASPLPFPHVPPRGQASPRIRSWPSCSWSTLLVASVLVRRASMLQDPIL